MASPAPSQLEQSSKPSKAVPEPSAEVIADPSSSEKKGKKRKIEEVESETVSFLGYCCVFVLTL